MKSIRLVSLLLLIFSASFTHSTTAQQASTFQVVEIAPYDKAAPGQVMQLLVENLEGGASPMMLPATDFQLTVSQDGVSQPAKIRTVTAILKGDRAAPRGASDPPPAMRAFQSVNFVVPKGLHSGPAELSLSYRGQTGNSITLNVVDRPLRPAVGTAPVVTLNTSALPPPPTRIKGSDFGWRLERGQTARFLVNPLTDPDDPNSAVVIRFKQGDVYYDAQTRIINQSSRVENRNRGVGIFPARDMLEVEVPAALEMGPAEVEIHVRANGQDGDAVTLKATITDSARSTEAPAINAPRLLLVSPRRVGAGQSLMLSVDYRRTLNPDPSRTQIAIEQGTARYIVPAERSSLQFGPSEQDAPVLLFVRTTKQITGKAQIKIFNELRGETGMSEAIPIEVTDDPLPPELHSVRESTEVDLAPLRQHYEMLGQTGRRFPQFDPQGKYVTILAKGLDYHPDFVRITFVQAGQAFTLKRADFSSYLNDTLIVRQPKELKAGPVKITIENRGADGFSTPAIGTFEICCTP